jgi:hypothetical protein
MGGKNQLSSQDLTYKKIAARKRNSARYAR